MKTRYYQIIETGDLTEVWHHERNNQDVVCINKEIFWPLPIANFKPELGPNNITPNQNVELISIYSKWWKET